MQGRYVYFFSRPVHGARPIRYINRNASHVGIIIDDPKEGLVIFEFDKQEKGNLVIRHTDKFEAKHKKKKKYPWLYKIGFTYLSFQKLVNEAHQAKKELGRYGLIRPNCRTFVNTFVKKILSDSKSFYLGGITGHNACEEAESKFWNGGSNAPEVLIARKHRVSNQGAQLVANVINQVRAPSNNPNTANTHMVADNQPFSSFEKGNYALSNDCATTDNDNSIDSGDSMLINDDCNEFGADDSQNEHDRLQQNDSYQRDIQHNNSQQQTERKQRRQRLFITLMLQAVFSAASNERIRKYLLNPNPVDTYRNRIQFGVGQVFQSMYESNFEGSALGVNIPSELQEEIADFIGQMLGESGVLPNLSHQTLRIFVNNSNLILRGCLSLVNIGPALYNFNARWQSYRASCLFDEAMRQPSPQAYAAFGFIVDILGQQTNLTDKETRQYIHALYKKHQASNRVLMRTVEPDGNCLFNAVSVHCQYSASELRQMAADYIQNNQDQFQGFCNDSQTIQTLVEHIRQQSNWGGEFELRALELCLQRPIYVANYNRPPSVDVANHEPIYIVYHQQLNHFDALIVPETDRYYEYTQRELMEENERLKADMGNSEAIFNNNDSYLPNREVLFMQELSNIENNDKPLHQQYEEAKQRNQELEEQSSRLRSQLEQLGIFANSETTTNQQDEKEDQLCLEKKS